MRYEYSAVNRLEHPHAYMYTAFEGTPFLRAYLASRLQVIDELSQCDAVSNADEIFFNVALTQITQNYPPSFFSGLGSFPFSIDSDFLKDVTDGRKDVLAHLAQRYTGFSTERLVVTTDLLQSIIAVQALNSSSSEIKLWLDRLVQRFEVSKKLFATYSPGFRKGEGVSNDTRLYCLLALSLSLFYSKSQELKYLNTLIKLCDLLCSLPIRAITRELPKQALQLILAFELASIQALLKAKGVCIDIE